MGAFPPWNEGGSSLPLIQQPQGQFPGGAELPAQELITHPQAGRSTSCSSARESGHAEGAAEG